MAGLVRVRRQSGHVSGFFGRAMPSGCGPRRGGGGGTAVFFCDPSLCSPDVYHHSKSCIQGTHESEDLRYFNQADGETEGNIAGLAGHQINLCG